MSRKKLDQIVTEYPFPDYVDWWDVGSEFLGFMSEAIVSQWTELKGNQGDLETVNSYLAEYIRIVYHRQTRGSLLADFVAKQFSTPIRSGEFDALSYAFFRSAFELTKERRGFTQRVGARFYALVEEHLNLDLPDGLGDEQDFARLNDSLRRVGGFLQTSGYLRDHFDFRFAVNEEHGGVKIKQNESEFIESLKRNGIAYAVYEMGYPIILPSAVYLYHTLGEAQHHSSRTIEELFERVGYAARETDDFDPTNYPSDRVVELWEIRKARSP